MIQKFWNKNKINILYNIVKKNRKINGNIVCSFTHKYKSFGAIYRKTYKKYIYFNLAKGAGKREREQNEHNFLLDDWIMRMLKFYFNNVVKLHIK